MRVIDRSLLACMLVALMFALPAPAWARSSRPYAIAMVLQAPKSDVERAFEAYFDKRGETIRTTEITFSGRDKDQPALIAHLRALAPDLIYTADTGTTLAVAGPVNANPARFITDIPVVFSSVSDPVAAGLVASTERPGANVTGVIPLAPMSTQLNALRDFQTVKSIGYLYGGDAQMISLRDRLREVCRKQNINLLEAKVPTTPDGRLDTNTLPILIAELKRGGAQFLYIGPETFTTAPLQEAVVHAALQEQLPTFSALESAVRKHGALFGVVSPAANIGRFAAFKASRILSGAATPSTEPVETLEQFSIVINMQTAIELQVYPPLSLLDAADVVTASATRTH